MYQPINHLQAVLVWKETFFGFLRLSLCRQIVCSRVLTSANDPTVLEKEGSSNRDGRDWYMVRMTMKRRWLQSKKHMFRYV